jgi:predicted TIM-barrel fold metal-dependent hydrolase
MENCYGSGPLMAIDIHAHYIPPRVLDELERRPGSYGVGVERHQSLAETLAGPSAGGRFSGVATVPLQDGKRAADELTYAVGRLGLRGAQIGTNVLGAGLDAAGLDPFWETAEALAVPIILHPWAVAGEERMRRHGMIRLVGYPADTTLAAASMVFGGIADRYPGLRVVLVHAGGSFRIRRAVSSVRCRSSRSRDRRRQRAMRCAGSGTTPSPICRKR